MVIQRVEALIHLQLDALAELLFALDDCVDNSRTAHIASSMDRISDIVHATVNSITCKQRRDTSKSKTYRIKSPHRARNVVSSAVPSKGRHANISHKWRYACQNPETRFLVERTLLKVSAIWKCKRHTSLMKYLLQWKQNVRREERKCVTPPIHQTEHAPIENIYSRLYGKLGDADISLEESVDESIEESSRPNVLKVSQFLRSKPEIASPPTSTPSSPRFPSTSFLSHEDMNIQPIDLLRKQRRHHGALGDHHEESAVDDISVVSDLWTTDPDSYYAHGEEINDIKNSHVVVETRVRKMPHRLRPPPPPIIYSKKSGTEL